MPKVSRVAGGQLLHLQFTSLHDSFEAEIVHSVAIFAPKKCVCGGGTLGSR